MLSDVFIDALEKLIIQHELTYSDDSFSIEINGEVYNVDFHIEAAPVKNEPTFQTVSDMIQYMKDNPGDWSPADDPSNLLKGFLRYLPNGKGDWITIFHLKLREASEDQINFFKSLKCKI